MRALLILLAALLAAATFTATAGAATAPRHLNPPGFSGINQYTEVVPTSSGSTPTGGLGAGSGLPPGAARALGGSSAAGAKALSHFVAATAPSARPRSGPALAGADGGQSPLGSLAAGVGGAGGGLGLLLPLIMAASVLVAAALLLLRRRARS